MKKNIIKLSFVVAIAIFIFWISSNYFDVLTVKTHTIKRENIVSTVRVTCLVQPKEKYFLSFNIDGRITSMNIDLGSNISENETLAKLDSLTAREGLILGQQKLLEKNYEVTRLQNEYDQAKKLLSKGAKQKSEVTLLLDNLEKAKSDLSLEKKYYNIQKEKIEYLSMKTPVPGIVIDLNPDISEGKFVKSGDFFATIGEIRTLKLEGFVDVEDSDLFKKNQEILIFKKNSPKPYKGHLTEITKVANKGKIRIYVETNENFVPGSFVDIEVPKTLKKNVLKVPHQAIYKDTYLWIIKNKKAYKTKVKLNTSDIWGVEAISKDINEGILVITNPGVGLKNGQRVAY